MTLLLEEALEILLKKVQVQSGERVALEECYGRILAEDVATTIDFPPFDRSPLDGYAIRKADVVRATDGQPVLLRQVDNVPAGSVPQRRVQAGMATRIMTGAKIPEGADAVVRLEDVIVTDDQISIFAPITMPNICYQGEELQRGDIVLTKGTVLKEGALGLLAMLGQVAPLVYEQPKVAILATGTEVIAIDQALTPGKIRNSNSYMLLAKVKEAGCKPILLGQVCDDLDCIEQRLKGHENIAMYITTGGASVGDYDLMEQVFARLQIPLLCTRLSMKPGMPVMAGYWHNNSLLVALSGNPAAANVSFEALLRPVLKKMSGATVITRATSNAKLKKAFTKPSTSRRFVWARCAFEEGVLVAEPIGFQGNGMLSGMLTANALLDIPANSDCLQRESEVQVRLLLD